ncbi:N-6 DNA methylase, partial [Cyanothece sp. BG0011]|uniref:N-6 DNA methylase n=1 Tax=Cyanothece sp. BG0011 TaxID=2082950 RepID=UPI000D1F9DBD
MSRLLISQYQAEVERIIQYGGSRHESSIRNAFQSLLNEYCKTRDFLLIPELPYKDQNIRPDGTVKDALRLDWGYWESKDQYDNLDEEIEKKLSKGYPNDNILFEDSQTAVLIQGGEEKLRVSMQDSEGLDGLINQFINYVRPEVKDFREAIDSFKEDLPTILDSLREIIAKQSQENKKFIAARDKFLTICQESINPEITIEDVREMIIQHILTEDIFLTIFNESQFHRENNIARELQGVINTFFTGSVRRNTLSSIERYYGVIRRTAASIYNHHEKQKFLKAIYENFYKAYNPKAADRLGIVYTPNEIVRFMIESVDYLVHKHFGKLLCDSGVEILDPATGTGTFVTELIEYLPKDKLKYKYQNEIHCNEVQILPYYIANLNIEYTYQQKMNEYEEFNNICFVDTLDHTSFTGKQLDLFALTIENTERIKNQNDRQISVIIGNPPYNANQQNENDNNKNRKYPEIDKRIKETYVKESKAQKTKVYDMYSRFIRWGTDRLGDNGIIAFVTNSSFINAKTFDGFRKIVSQDFSHIYIIDLDGDIRAGDNTGNVFKVKIGIAISFMIKKKTKDKIPCQILYHSQNNVEIATDKLNFLVSNKLANISFEHINPDINNNWINLTDNDFADLLSLADKETKAAKHNDEEKSIFKLYSNGISTNRDEWLIDKNKINLLSKIEFFIDRYEYYQEQENTEFPGVIKWSR